MSDSPSGFQGLMMPEGTPDTVTLRQIGPYRCVSRVACGGVGTVWLAQTNGKPTDLALKILHRNLMRVGYIRRDFAREYAYGRRFGHKGLLRFHEYGEFNGCPYMVMEYFPSATLKTLMAGEERGKAQFLADAFIRQVAAALIPVHEAGVVHRDIKPDNILVNEEALAAGELDLRVIDFSMAVSGWRRWFPFGRRAAGTPTYIAPEIILGKTPSPASDVFSLGATLYELFAGKPPFSGASPQEILQSRLKNKAEPLHKHHVWISDAFSRLVAAMLEKEPAARPPDMGAVVRQLERVGGIFNER